MSALIFTQGVPFPMTPKIVGPSTADDAMDPALHEQIKSRAYELYERRGDYSGAYDPKIELQSELLRVAYAVAQLQKYSDGGVGDTRVVRAARVYLRALTSFIGQA